MTTLKSPKIEKVSLDWDDILKWIQSKTTSELGRGRVREWEPFKTPESALNHVKEVFYGLEIINSGIRPFMESLDHFDLWMVRLKKKALMKIVEIKDIRHFCLEALALSEALKPHSNPWTEEILSQLMNAEEPLSAIDQIVTPQGEIRNDASETLYQLTKEKNSLARQVQNILDGLVKNHQMVQTILQDKYVTTREGRWVLPIKSGMQHSVPGMIQGSSQTKQTVFIEPQEVIPLNNRLHQIEIEIEDEIERLLYQLSLYLNSLCDDFLLARDCLLKCDVLFAFSQWTIMIDGKTFIFSPDEIYLNEIRHPLMQLGTKKPVANNVRLTPEKGILILSGPNAGGKTVLLKAIGLACHMARCGLPLCGGEGCHLPFFEKIHIGMGDAQSVFEELSTFAAHLMVLNESLQLKGCQNLILVDEICGATDPEEGAALARSFIEVFSENNVFAVITSHLGPLKSGWPPDSRVLNGCLEYDSKSGRPTYQFLPGIPGDSLAIQTAKRVGVPDLLIDRATELLSPVTRQRLAGLEELEHIKKDTQLLIQQLKKDQQKAQSEQQKYKELRDIFEKEKDQQLKKFLAAAEKKIDEIIIQTKVEQTFQRHRSLQEIKRELPQIIKSSSGSSTPSKDTSTPQKILTAEDFSHRYPPGSRIFIPHLNRDGLIQSVVNSKGEVTILSGSIILTLFWTELRPPQQPINPTASLVRSTSVVGAVNTFPYESDTTLDLRGKRIEEGLDLLEKEIDKAINRNQTRLKIIHGFGTETLKKAVRAYLSRSIYVKLWKAGTADQGGDGITWVEL